MKEHFMTDSDLEKVEGWLKQNASKIVQLSLQKPASNEELLELESEIGLPLPEDFKQLYLWHNGITDIDNVGNLFYAMDFYPIDRIVKEHRYLRENIRSEKRALKMADKELEPYHHSFNRLQFAFDGSHTALFLDLSPTSEGHYGQIIFIDSENEIGILVAHSTAALLSDFAKDLENNRYCLNPEALEDGNHFLKANANIDIVNWHTSEKWKR